MLLFRKALRPLAVIALISSSLCALAVTDAEMDQARAIAGKFYVRYVNDGAGYLDNWTPKSMEDLEKKLSNKTDKDNLNKFKSASTASDYASWDKEKLAAYWSETFFKDNAASLDAKGAANGQCRKNIKKAIGQMAVAAQVTATEPEQEAAPDQSGQAELEEAITDEFAQAEAEIQEAHDMVDNEQEAAASDAGDSSASGTWVYVMILAILVAIVIFLVIYASKTMKGQPRKGASEGNDDAGEAEEEEKSEVSVVSPVKGRERSEDSRFKPGTPDSGSESPRVSVADDSRMREKYAEALAAKAEEIRTLNRQLAEAEKHIGDLKDENRSLVKEVERLRKFSAAAQPAPQSAPSESRYSAREEGRQPESKEIYLGRVNSKGLFVRADRHAVEGQSVYKLTTSTGVSGSFTLIHSSWVEKLALEDPGKWIAGGCFAKDIFDTEGRRGISMETPGRAVFKDGAWRVERKAKIKYI